MRTANLAIAFTDIQGFTERTSRQTLEENKRLLQVHAELLVPLFRAFGGRIVKSIGDAFLVTFESPTQAVLSGIAIQDHLWNHNRTMPEAERLRVRVAINVGEVRLETGDVFGEPVNIAARVESIAEAGEVFFTEAVYLAMNKAEVPSEEVGAFELKGIPGRIRVYRVPRAPYRVEAPAPDAAAAADGPPFGNLALARVAPSVLERGGPVDLGVLGQRAALLGTQAVSAGGRLLHDTTDVLARGLPRSRKRQLVLGGALLVVLVGAVLALRGGPASRAIQDVRSAPPAERFELAEQARALIADEVDAGRRAFLTGQLEEALGLPGRATGLYRSAVRAGNGAAEDRLVEMLEHPECRVRASAADALGDLRLASARGALEDLAEAGGQDEGLDIPLIGCNSRRAAQDALRRLGD